MNPTKTFILSLTDSPSLLEPIHVLLADVDLSKSRERRVARDLLEEYFYDAAPTQIVEALEDELEFIDWDTFLDWYEVNYCDQYDFQEQLEYVLASV
jgi:hypothetical protein